jgi:hypothetical protein
VIEQCRSDFIDRTKPNNLLVGTRKLPHAPQQYVICKIMNVLKDTLLSIKSGWHEGKGHKNARKGEDKTALYHYSQALESSTDEIRKAGIHERGYAFSPSDKNSAQL